MAEQRADGGQVDAVAHEFRGEGVAQGVGGDLVVEPDLLAEFLQHALSFPRGERLVVLPGKERRRSGGGEASGRVELQELGDAFFGHGVQGHGAGAASLGDGIREPDFIARLAVEGDEVDVEFAGFTDAKPRVVEEQDQQIVPFPEGAVEVDATKEPFDLVGFHSEHS